ncbi:MAG TPA: DUF3568 family protein [Gemmatimonadales bacterium]|nr:DUF3568 family protein [Gemmatimonadales bacterium]
MRECRQRLEAIGLAVLAAATSACVLAAAGAGAGGAIYVTDRGVQSVVAAPVEQTFLAVREAFRALEVTETKSTSEQDGLLQKRSLEGKTQDRDVQVDLRTEGTGTKVDVVVKKSAVTWDKDFAKRLLNTIVERAK